MNKVTHGTTNVFADLGYTDAGECQVKTRLALAINDLLKGRELKQREIAEILGVLQPKVSARKNYPLDQFSIEKLIAYLTTLNRDVEIMIRPYRTTGESGSISVLAVQ